MIKYPEPENVAFPYSGKTKIVEAIDPIYDMSYSDTVGYSVSIDIPFDVGDSMWEQAVNDKPYKTIKL